LTSYTSAELTAILVQVAIALLVVRRSYAMTQGVPYSSARLLILPVLLLVLWSVTELESILLTPWAVPYLLALDAGLVVATAYAFTGIAERATEVSAAPAGGWSYRIGFALAALFVGAFVVRLAVVVTLFPSALEFGSPVAGFPPVQQQLALGGIDALFSVSVGLLVGRSVGIARKVRAVQASSAGATAP
jgi:hypothetical protein